MATRKQLLGHGLDRNAIDRGLRSGRFTPIFRGVYLIDRVDARPLSRVMAAMLACRPNAFISHFSAAWVWGLLDATPNDVHVTVVGRHSDGPRGIRVHRVASLVSRDRRSRHNVPITSPGRTLADLAATASRSQVEEAAARARGKGLLTDADLAILAAASVGRRGGSILKAIKGTGAARTRSEAERRFLTLIREAGLTMPEVNAPEGEFVVDFLWRREGVVVEVDGFEFHSSRAAYEADRRRDAVLHSRGLVVTRLTWNQLEHEWPSTLVRLTQLLAARVHRAA